MLVHVTNELVWTQETLLQVTRLQYTLLTLHLLHVLFEATCLTLQAVDLQLELTPKLFDRRLPALVLLQLQGLVLHDQLEVCVEFLHTGALQAV